MRLQDWVYPNYLNSIGSLKLQTMNTRLLMQLSAILMGALGILTQFMPQELLQTMGMQTAGSATLLVQTIGSLYLGFATMNWMAKGVLIGGIYAKPLAMGNLAHFMIGALALIKAGFALEAMPLLWLTAVVYSAFALAFALVAFRHPLKARATG